MKGLKYTRSMTLLVIIGLSIILTSCDEIFDCEVGRGPTETRVLNLSQIKSFELNGSADVYISQGADQEVVVEGQENILDLLELDVDNGHWEIDFRDCIRRSDDLRFYITLPEYQFIALSGSGNIYSENIIEAAHLKIELDGSGRIMLDVDTDNLEAEITGSGDINLDGYTKNSNFEIIGSGSIKALDLLTEVCEAEIAGSGNIQVNVIESLEANISGSGNIRYKGNPSVSQSINGSGKLIRID